MSSAFVGSTAIPAFSAASLVCGSGGTDCTSVSSSAHGVGYESAVWYTGNPFSSLLSGCTGCGGIVTRG
ncbi:MAG: hypothetical protein OEV06_12820 [Anaerolineae bacterium]|nr:hypothetical protein [Anaerolineae bacterium]